MWISDVRLVLPDRVIEHGAIEIVDGRIGRIVEGAPPRAREMAPAHGLTAIPGIIDLHGDMLERELEPRPRARFPIEMAMHELDKRLAATGITTAYAAIGFAWNAGDLRTQENAILIIETLNQIRHTLLTDCRIHARFEVNNHDTVPVLDSMLRRGMLDLVSIMDHTPGQGQYNDTTRYTQFLREWLGFTEEQLAPVYARIEEKVAVIQSAPRDWTVTRAIVGTARAHGVVVASHDDDTAEKVAAQAKMDIGISEFPINVESAQAARAHGMHVMMGAPNAYRGESNTGNLSARAAVRAGLVDILATDYYPASMLHAVWKMAREGDLPLHEAVRLITLNPAQAVGLTERGRLAEGAQADLVLVEDGETPRVRATLRAGELIYSDTHGARLWQVLALAQPAEEAPASG